MAEVRPYFRAALRWWWLILLSTSLAAVGSYITSSRQPRVYSTSTTLMVGQIFREANPSSQDFYTTAQLAQSYAQIGRRQPILQATIDSLDLQTSWQSLQGQVYIQQIPNTNLLEVSVFDYSPERAVAIADEIARQLILQSPSSPENQARQERGGFIRTQLDDLESRIESGQARIKELQAELAEAFSARKIQDLQTEISSLETLINGWQANYAELLRFLEGGDSSNYLTVIEPAQLSTRPVSPAVNRNVLLAAAVGLVLAIGAVVLLEYIDDTIRSPDDVSETLGLTYLGGIGRIDGKDPQEKLIAATKPLAPESEAYRMIRSNLQFMADNQSMKSLLITSPAPSVGKSTVASNLAVIMAQADLKTIIIDADLRRPTLHKIFGTSNSEGLSNLLYFPGLEIHSQLKDTEMKNLRLITSGPLPSNPTELLGSRQMAQLLQCLEEMVDVIILDSSPVLAVTDALVLSNKVDGVILVTKARSTSSDITHRAIKNLQQVGANILGGVLNQIPKKDQDGYYFYNYYGYGENGSIYPHNFKQPSHWQNFPLSKK